MSSKHPSKNDYSKLKRLLQDQETFPLEYVHKFIGRNTPTFLRSVEELERNYPALKRQTARKSSGDKHLALTYVFTAANADEVIELLKATESVDEILLML